MGSSRRNNRCRKNWRDIRIWILGFGFQFQLVGVDTVVDLGEMRRGDGSSDMSGIIPR